MSWRVRHAGSPAPIPVAGPDRIVAGLRDGDWDVSDEVQGPDDTTWRAIEDHPAFAEACELLAEPAQEKKDESHIDMNPMIDVALVLLIFFILTTTYASLRRSIELPEAPTDKKGAPKPQPKPDDAKQRYFTIKINMVDDRPEVRIEDKIVSVDDLEKEILDMKRSTGKNEVYAKIDPAVPWGIETKLYDACRGAEIKQIYWPKKK